MCFSVFYPVGRVARAVSTVASSAFLRLYIPTLSFFPRLLSTRFVFILNVSSSLFSFSFNRFSIMISGLSHRFLFDGIRRSIKSHRAFHFIPWRCPWANDRRAFHSNSRFSFREMETSLLTFLVRRIISLTFVDTKNGSNGTVEDSKIERISVAIS